ncbi:MAG: hypothetical protein ACI4Q3_05640 [Kiritimatiellia bacterium]
MKGILAVWTIAGAILGAAGDAAFPKARIVAEQSVDSRLAGKDPVRAMRRFAGYGGEAAKAGRFTPNPDFWAKGVDFSCASMWNSQGGNTRAGTAVTPRHVVFAHHYALQPGTRLDFWGTDGTVHSRKLVATCRVSTTDLAVGALDADLPGSVRPAPILPADYATYLGRGADVPCVAFDYEEKALVVELAAIPNGRRETDVRTHAPRDANRLRFFEQLVAGDSGNPVFLVMNEDAILLLTSFRRSVDGAPSGPSPTLLRTLLQYEMDRLAPGYRLREYDFSAYR